MNSARNYIFGSGKSTLLNGLIAYWKLDSNLLDSHSTHHGTGLSISYTTGKSGNGINFTGTSQYMDSDNSSDFTFSDGVSTDYPFSISYWVKYSSTAAFNQQFLKLNNGFVSYTTPTGLGIRLLLSIDASFSAYLIIDSPDFISTGVWYNIIHTYSGSKTTAGMKTYVNGVLQTATPITSGTYTRMNNTSVATLRLTSNLGTPMVMDESAIWNRVLTSTEATTIYNSGVGKFYPF